MSAHTIGERAEVEQLILLAAGTATRRRELEHEAERLADAVSWPRLATTMRVRRLLPLLGPRLAPLAERRAQSDFAATVAESIDNARHHGAFLQMVAGTVRTMLSQAGIRSQQLKGPALGEQLYGDLGRRPAGDIDLLVPVDRLRDAVRISLTLGYQPPIDRTDSHGLPLLHFAMAHRRGELPPLELHWRVHWYERRFAAEQLLPPATADTDGWRAKPVDELAALLLFYARDGFMNTRHAVDIAAWWDLVGETLAPGALDELCRAYPSLEQALLTSALVAERSVGLPFARLSERRPVLGLRARTAARLASSRPRESESQIYADMGLIDGLLAPRSQLPGFVRRQLLTPPQTAHGHERGSHAPARARIGHGARSVARYGLTLGRLLRPSASQRIVAGGR